MKRLIPLFFIALSFFCTQVKAELYNPSTRILFMETVTVNGRIYTNVNVRLDDIQVLEIGRTPNYTNSFDPSTNTLSLSHVRIDGKGDYYWLKVVLNAYVVLTAS